MDSEGQVLLGLVIGAFSLMLLGIGVSELGAQDERKRVAEAIAAGLIRWSQAAQLRGRSNG